jgi:hypothetical protein
MVPLSLQLSLLTSGPALRTAASGGPPRPAAARRRREERHQFSGPAMATTSTLGQSHRSASRCCARVSAHGNRGSVAHGSDDEPLVRSAIPCRAKERRLRSASRFHKMISSWERALGEGAAGVAQGGARWGLRTQPRARGHRGMKKAWESLRRELPAAFLELLVFALVALPATYILEQRISGRQEVQENIRFARELSIQNGGTKPMNGILLVTPMRVGRRHRQLPPARGLGHEAAYDSLILQPHLRRRVSCRLAAWGPGAPPGT